MLMWLTWFNACLLCAPLAQIAATIVFGCYNDYIIISPQSTWSELGLNCIRSFSLTKLWYYDYYSGSQK